MCLYVRLLSQSFSLWSYAFRNFNHNKRKGKGNWLLKLCRFCKVVAVWKVVRLHLLPCLICLTIFQVASFPFNDHNCPPIQLITFFCQSAYSWLKQDIENVVVVHCKAGMARTGLMISSLLLFLKVRIMRYDHHPHKELFPEFIGKLLLIIIFLHCPWIQYFLCHFPAVLPNSWGVHQLLQPKKMHRWEGSSSPKPDCQSIIYVEFNMF